MRIRGNRGGGFIVAAGLALAGVLTGAADPKTEDAVRRVLNALATERAWPAAVEKDVRDDGVIAFYVPGPGGAQASVDIHASPAAASAALPSASGLFHGVPAWRAAPSDLSPLHSLGWAAGPLAFSVSGMTGSPEADAEILWAAALREGLAREPAPAEPAAGAPDPAVTFIRLWGEAGAVVAELNCGGLAPGTVLRGELKRAGEDRVIQRAPGLAPETGTVELRFPASFLTRYHGRYVVEVLVDETVNARGVVTVP